jgi:hypothetical protein
LTGITVDISVLLHFHFWEKVYYKLIGKSTFPLHSTEEVGNIVGSSEHCWHVLTWKILTADTNVIILRSIVCPCTTADGNVCAELLGGEKLYVSGSKMDLIIKSRDDMTEGANQVST